MARRNLVGNLITLALLALGGVGLIIWLSVRYAVSFFWNKNNNKKKNAPNSQPRAQNAAKITYATGTCYVIESEVVSRVDYWNVTLTTIETLKVNVTIKESGNKYPNTRLASFKENNTYDCVYDTAKPITGSVWWSNPKTGILVALIIVLVISFIPIVIAIGFGGYFAWKGLKHLVRNINNSVDTFHVSRRSVREAEVTAAAVELGSPEISKPTSTVSPEVTVPTPARTGGITRTGSGFFGRLFSNPFKH